MKKITVLILSFLILYGCVDTYVSRVSEIDLRARIVNLNEETKRQNTQPEYLNKKSNPIICKVATKVDGSSFESLSSKFANYVQEARSRGFSLESCNQLTGRGNNQTTTKIASNATNLYVCQRATKSDGSSFESFSSSYVSFVEEAGNRGFNLESCNQLTGRGNNEMVTQTAQVPKTKIDKTAPVLDVEDRITVTKRNYTISGKVSDESDVFVEADGISIPVKNNKFTLTGSSLVGHKEYKIVAFDQWGNETKKTILVERVIQTVNQENKLELLDPEKLRAKRDKNRIALIIGIEQYENISNANYAKRDAQLFIDYVVSAFGVPQNNIKYLFNENAKEKSKFDIKRWLKKNVRKNTEVYVYFSGHGIALNNGKDLYLLTNDTQPDFVEETAFNRNEIFNDIAQYNPKSVTAFLDTCYSGAGRADGEMLLAMAKGLVVVDEQQQQLPDNFTLFTAASAQESAWSLPEAKHGTFSYFLMKGMEGEADLNKDKKLTNGELQEYLLDNVGRFAQQQQTPQMIGNPDQVLVRF
ncbi:caspase family protein [Pelagibacteraceae bacterium]|nr:caspase family protein [Pelagibacteraceae bacterium]